MFGLLTEFLYVCVDRKSQVNVIYTDLEKSFEKVNHANLLDKLQFYGICGQLLSWIKDYLTERRRNIVIDGVLSDEYIPISGVPQASYIGPLLFFTIYYDIVTCFHYSKCSLYADDLKILYTEIRSLDDSNNLHCDLDVIFESPLNVVHFQFVRYAKHPIFRHSLRWDCKIV